MRKVSEACAGEKQHFLQSGRKENHCPRHPQVVLKLQYACQETKVEIRTGEASKGSQGVKKQNENEF